MNAGIWLHNSTRNSLITRDKFIAILTLQTSMNEYNNLNIAIPAGSAYYLRMEFIHEKDMEALLQILNEFTENNCFITMHMNVKRDVKIFFEFMSEEDRDHFLRLFNTCKYSKAVKMLPVIDNYRYKILFTVKGRLENMLSHPPLIPDDSQLSLSLVAGNVDKKRNYTTSMKILYSSNSYAADCKDFIERWLNTSGNGNKIIMKNMDAGDGALSKFYSKKEYFFKVKMDRPALHDLLLIRNFNDINMKFNLQEISSGVIIESLEANHMIVSGKSGSGKSTALSEIAVEWMNRGYFLFLLDPHAELAKKTHAMAAMHGNKTVLITPLMDNLPSINPFQFKDASNFGVMSENIVYILQKMSFKSEEYFGFRMERILAILSYVAMENNGDFEMLYNLLTDKRKRINLLSSSSHEMAIDLLNEITVLEKRYPDFLLPSVTRVSKLLMNQNVKKFLCNGKYDLSIKKALTDCKGLIFDLNESLLGMEGSSAVGSILITYLFINAINHLFREVPVLLVVDELNLFDVPSIATLLSEARKYNLHLLLSVQGLNMLNEKTGSAIESNVNNHIMFNSSQSDSRNFARKLALSKEEQDLLTGMVLSLPPHTGVVKLNNNLYELRTKKEDCSGTVQEPFNPELISELHSMNDDYLLLENKKEYLRRHPDTELLDREHNLTEKGVYRVGGYPLRGSPNESREHALLIKKSFEYFLKYNLVMSIPEQGDFAKKPDGEILFLDQEDLKNPEAVLKKLELLKKNEYWIRSRGRNISIEAEYSTASKSERILIDIEKAVKANRYLVFVVYESSREKLSALLKKEVFDKYRRYIEDSTELLSF